MFPIYQNNRVEDEDIKPYFIKQHKKKLYVMQQQIQRNLLNHASEMILKLKINNTSSIFLDV